MTRAAVLLWDYNQPVDLEKLARVVNELSAGRVHLREVDTGGQEIAVVVTDVELSGVVAAEVFDRWRENQATMPEMFELNEGDPR